MCRAPTSSRNGVRRTSPNGFADTVYSRTGFLFIDLHNVFEQLSTVLCISFFLSDLDIKEELRIRQTNLFSPLKFVLHTRIYVCVIKTRILSICKEKRTYCKASNYGEKRRRTKSYEL